MIRNVNACEWKTLCNATVDAGGGGGGGDGVAAKCIKFRLCNVSAI